MVILSLSKYERVVHLEEMGDEERQSITQLNLIDLGLYEIPPVVFTMKNLVSLNLTDNHITYIPREILELTNLTCLHLNGTRISRLPRFIEKMNLDILNVSHMNVETLYIPKEICMTTINLFYLYDTNASATREMADATDATGGTKSATSLAVEMRPKYLLFCYQRDKLVGDLISRNTFEALGQLCAQFM